MFIEIAQRCIHRKDIWSNSLTLLWLMKNLISVVKAVLLASASDSLHMDCLIHIIRKDEYIWWNLPVPIGCPQGNVWESGVHKFLFVSACYQIAADVSDSWQWKTHKVFQEFILDKLYLLLCPWGKVWRWCGSLKFCSNFLFIFLCFCRNWSIVIWMFYHFVAGQSVVVAASISEWSALHTLINNSWSFYMLVRRLPKWAVLGQNKLQYAVDLNEWMSEWCIYITL